MKKKFKDSKTKNKRKIIIITRNMCAGGAERVIAQLSNYLIKKKTDCTIITTDKSEVFYDLDRKIKLIPVGRKSKNKIFDRIICYTIIRKIVIKERPYVVLTMPEDTGIYAILALVGTGIPVFVSERNNPWKMPDVNITRFLRHLAYPFAKCIIFQTETAKSFFSKNIQKKGIVLPNPVDATRIPEKYTGVRKKIITGVGRLSGQKNFKLLIDAFNIFLQKNADYVLHIYGEGDLRKELEEYIKNLGLENKVALLGRKQNILEIINSSACFVLSSDYEGMPNVLLESMCMGMPVVSTDCPSGGPRSLIKDGYNGFLVPVNDKYKMAEAIEKMSCEEIANKCAANAYLLRAKMTDKKIFEKWEKELFKN